jgi:hypothetical protein
LDTKFDIEKDETINNNPFDNNQITKDEISINSIAYSEELK